MRLLWWKLHAHACIGQYPWRRGQGGMAAVEVVSTEASEVSYPLVVDYCGVCGMPPEYCEYSPEPAKCYEWMKANLPLHYARVEQSACSQLEDLAVSDGKRQTRGGKALKKVKKKDEVRPHVTVSRSLRTKRKSVTVIVGLKTFDIDIKKASKCFAQHFSCGSSVTGEDEVVVQGDVYDNIIDLIQEKWPQVTAGSIHCVGLQKR